MSNSLPFVAQQESTARHSQRLLDSFQHWTGRSLIEVAGSPLEIARTLFEAPFVVVSHGTEANPIFNYGNRKALELWALSWEDFTQMPSRQSAEPSELPDRQRLLDAVAQKGFSDGHSGVRISTTGCRFLLEETLIWNVLDERGEYIGQAATFSQWHFLSSVGSPK
ncbi:MEKHLA domain-containing protein [Oscillatoria sp. FACHB-1406]|uniref:MEKHLA domain-containing protein n=1 Tax=Oscillatoria sp. FACHB-1406 TaxID=2692846 RepID=UPI0016883027|nr:MEKHLA domain-containing protein [Oscillatoria sp. FACHB-1406]MBD2578696.1 MEKHLA domain-containing protein [Oscillatoria sp. FACHB-1406]